MAIVVGPIIIQTDMDCVMKKILENHLTKLDGQVAQSLSTISLEFIAETAPTGSTILINLNAAEWLQVQNMRRATSKHKKNDKHILK